MEGLAGRYRLERELGRGGMAIVFLASDLRHNRQVALKVLRPELSAAVGRERFLREVQVTAQLQHPHILPVFDSGDALGQLWYTMPYVDGETLRARLVRVRRVPVAAAIQVAREVASALASAHDAGVVHRDIKPENILLSRQGQALVADFGIAKALMMDQGLTDTGMALGTPSYMAPELILGERPVRPQSDVYALGVVLHEMLSGERPFADAAPAAMLAKRLTDGAPLLSSTHPEVPHELAALVRDALEVDPSRRPASGAVFGARLSSVAERAVVSRPEPPGSRRARRGLVLAAVVAAAVALVAWVALMRPSPEGAVAIGVLPFENQSADSSLAYLSDGVSDELSARLSAVPELTVSPRSATVRYRGSPARLEVIARELEVGYLLTGAVARQGDSVRVSVELVDAPGKRQRWSRVHEGPVRALAAVVDSVAREVTRTLVPSAALERARARRVTGDSLAYNYFLLALHHWNRFTEPSLHLALAYSDSAIARDPAFVAAWNSRANAVMALASGNGTLSGREALATLRQAVDTILALDPNASSAHAIRGLAYTWFEWDWDAADREFRQALALEPNTAITLNRASFLQTVRGNADSALALNARARRLEPTELRAHAGIWQYYGRRYEEAVAVARRGLELDPYFPAALQHLALGLGALGRHSEAVAVARRANANPSPSLAAALAIVLAGADSAAEARAVLAGLEQRVTATGTGAGFVFRVYAALGDAEGLFAWLDRAIAERSWQVAFLHVDPLLDPYRSDPRYQAAITRAGLPRP